MSLKILPQNTQKTQKEICGNTKRAEGIEAI